MPAGQQRGKQGHHPGADHRNPSAAHSVPERAHVGPAQVRGGVQQAVGADRPHVRDVDAEQRIEVRGKRHHTVCDRVADVPGAMAVGHRHGGTLRDHGRPRLGDRGHLHVSQSRDRVAGVRLARHEEAEARVPAFRQERVRALDVTQFGAGGDAAEQSGHPERTRWHRPARLLPHCYTTGAFHHDVALGPFVDRGAPVHGGSGLQSSALLGVRRVPASGPVRFRAVRRPRGLARGR